MNPHKILLYIVITAAFIVALLCIVSHGNLPLTSTFAVPGDFQRKVS